MLGLCPARCKPSKLSGRRCVPQLLKTDGAAENSEGTAFKPKTLLPFMKRLPVTRVVHLPNITSDPVRF